MPSQIIKGLKSRYKNGYDNIGKDLFAPCLKECTLYRRGTGFFRASALIAWAGALDQVLKNNVKIEVICSPVITDKSFIEILKGNIDRAERKKTLQKLSDEIVLTAVGFGLNPDRVDYRSKLLAYLIANGQLEFRFAIPKNGNEFSESDQDRNLYHVKVGYFCFDDGSMVAFEGSVNESDSAHQYNTESASVFRSWVSADAERVNDVVEDLDRDWNRANPHLEVFDLSEEAIKKIKTCSPAQRPARPKTIKQPDITDPEMPPTIIFNKWKHQDAAITAFLAEKRGILNMATGTGKTKTALKIIIKLFKEKLIRTVIVSTEGNDLLGQWAQQINALAVDNRGLFSIHRHFGSAPGPVYREMNNFQLDYLDSVLIVSNANLKNAVDVLSDEAKGNLLLIHDEVHRIGSKSNRENLQGLTEKINWVLGLSATPEREYDEEGNKFIEEYIGKTIFQYDLKDAISDGILCPFNYHPLKYSPTQQDKDNIAAVFKQQAARAAAGIPMSDVDMYIALSKVYKLSTAKIPVFDEFIMANPSYLRRAIIFVEEKWYGDEVMKIIHKYRPDFHTYYSEDDAETLRRFAKGDLECLITCHKVSEGIDINSLENVILFSSAKAKLETIQRIGRCLRVDSNNPGKVANVIDFIRQDDEKFNPDDERSEWLNDLSLMKPKVDIR